MSRPPFETRHELEGWDLFWVPLETTGDAGDELAALRASVAAEMRERLEIPRLAEDPVVSAMRRLFRAAGCDPTRYRPSSEALLRRVLKGDELPAIHPLVDLNNCLSVRLVVPACALAEGSFEGPVTLRAGRAGESYASLRGPFNLEGKPLLADSQGPFGTPITDSQRVKVEPETRRAWLVAYLPHGQLAPQLAAQTLANLLERAPVARIAS